MQSATTASLKAKLVLPSSKGNPTKINKNASEGYLGGIFNISIKP